MDTLESYQDLKNDLHMLLTHLSERSATPTDEQSLVLVSNSGLIFNIIASKATTKTPDFAERASSFYSFVKNYQSDALIRVAQSYGVRNTLNEMRSFTEWADERGFEVFITANNVVQRFKLKLFFLLGRWL